MIPCAEKFALMVTSRDEGVRGWLALGAVEADCYGLVVTTPRTDLAMGLLVRQAVHWPATPRFDVLVTDQGLPGLSGIGLITQLQQDPAGRPFMARVIQPGHDAVEAVSEPGFDLVAPMPQSLASLTALFRTISDRCIAWFEGAAR